jgi:hypothetical protein
MKTEKDYLKQYLLDWKECMTDTFNDKDILDIFLKIKEKQFDLKSYKAGYKILNKK